MTHLGHPIVGDRLYGRARQAAGTSEIDRAIIRAFDRQALHAELLGFVHPATGKQVRFESELPIEITELIDVLERVK